MTQNNDYKTPRDRISAEFRERLYAEELGDTAETFLGVSDYGARSTSDTNARCRCNNAGLYTESRSNNTARRTENAWSDGLSLAMIYSPSHEFENLCSEEEALRKGTLFADLYFPFEAYCCGSNGTVQNGGWKR